MISVISVSCEYWQWLFWKVFLIAFMCLVMHGQNSQHFIIWGKTQPCTYKLQLCLAGMNCSCHGHLNRAVRCWWCLLNAWHHVYHFLSYKILLISKQTNCLELPSTQCSHKTWRWSVCEHWQLCGSGQAYAVCSSLFRIIVCPNMRLCIYLQYICCKPVLFELYLISSNFKHWQRVLETTTLYYGKTHLLFFKVAKW